jgi:hypothetical protein
MQVTQIFINWIEADGKTWAAIIDHSGGARTFHSLRGKRAAQLEARARGNARAASASGLANMTDGLAAFAVDGHKAVMCEDADRR